MVPYLRQVSFCWYDISVDVGETSVELLPRSKQSCNPLPKIWRVVTFIFHSIKNSFYKHDLVFFEKKIKNRKGEYLPITIVPTFSKTYILITDPKLIRGILKHERNQEGPEALFLGGIPSQTAQMILGDNLLSYSATKHQQVRKEIAPFFNSKHLIQMEESLVELSNDLISKWLNSKKGYFAPAESLPIFIVECVAKSLLGYQGSVQEIHQAMENLLELGIKKQRTQTEEVRYQQSKAILEDASRAILQTDDKAELIHGADRLSEKTGKELARLMFFAGFDTTSSWLEFLLHTLGKAENLQFQQLLFEEYSKSQQSVLEYALASKTLDKICQESLRLHPPAFVQTRVAANHLLFNKAFPIPKGAEIHLLHYFAGRNPAIWGKDAVTFSLEREIPKDILFPFSNGPTACLGKQFAIHLTKIFLMQLIVKCTFVSKNQSFTKTGNVAIKLVPNVEIALQPRVKK